MNRFKWRMVLLSMLLLFGALEVGLSHPVARNISEFAAKHDIRVEEMVKVELTRQIEEHDALHLNEGAAADAGLSAEIKGYGLQNVLFGSRPLPWMRLEIELCDSSGKVLGRETFRYKHAFAGNGKVRIYSIEEFGEDPERYRAMWEGVTAHSVSNLLDRMWGEP